MHTLHRIQSRMCFRAILGVFLLLKIVAGGFDIDSLHKTCETSGILCFGMKANKDPENEKCVKEKTCALQVAITKNKEHEGKVRFQLLGKLELEKDANGVPEEGVYVAVGLSDDDKMGDDSVVECVSSEYKPENGNVFASWNVGQTKKNDRLPEQPYITDGWVSYENGTLYCEFYRDANTTVEGHQFDLFSGYSKYKYHVLLAMGKTEHGDHLRHHEIRRASKTPILFKDAIKESGASLPSFQISIKIFSIVLSLLGSALY